MRRGHRGSEVHGCILNPVERLAIGRLGPPVGVPALADHPPPTHRRRGYPLQGLVSGPKPSQLHPVPVQGPETQMSVSIREPRRYEGIGKVITRDSPGRRPLELIGRAYHPNPAVLPEHRSPSVPAAMLRTRRAQSSPLPPRTGASAGKYRAGKRGELVAQIRYPHVEKTGK